MNMVPVIAEKIPTHWVVSKIKYGFDDIGSGTTPPTGDPEYYEEGTVPWITTGELREDIILQANQNLNESALNKFSALKLYPPGTVLIAMYGATIGRLAILGIEATVNQAVCALGRSKEFIPLFVYYYLQATKEFLILKSNGGGQPNINAETVKNHEILKPTLEEQNNIVEYLDRETAHIDSLIQAKEDLLARLAEKRQALVTQAVTRGLNPDVRLKPSGVDWLGDVPEHWEVKKLKHVAEVRGGIAVGKNYQTKRVTPFPYLRVANVQDGKLSLEDIKTIEVPADEAVSYFLEAGDVLMNEGGDSDKLGRGAIWDGSISPCLHQNHVFAVRPFGITSPWLNMWTSSEVAKAYFESRAKKATNLASISSSNLKELFVLLPSKQEQLSIVNWIEKQMNHLDDVQEKTTDSINLLKERRSALITAAVTGQIDVTQSDVNQETTSSRASVV